MSSPAFTAIVNRIFALQTGAPGVVKHGLRNSILLADALKNTRGADAHPPPATVHVAGTNGKGSVCSKVAEACRIAGLKTGLFTSPHITSFWCVRARVRYAMFGHLSLTMVLLLILLAIPPATSLCCLLFLQ